MNNAILITALLAGIILAVTGAALAAVFVLRRKSGNTDPGLQLLQQRIESLTLQINEQLHQVATQVNQRLGDVSRQVMDSQKTVGDRLDNAARVVGEVQKNLGALGQASEKIFAVGKDIAGLQDILRAPKMRGGLGEFFLGDLLGQILPAKHFTLQYGFRTGQTVDAVVHLGDRLVPVDAKFPLENFRRLLEDPTEEERKGLKKKFASDVKKHVDAIAAKYILPDEGTYDFALMYIPAENVYYECIVKDDAGEGGGLIEYALKQRVIPVSPGSFYAYLQAIVMGLKGFQIEENARFIMENLARLQGDFKKFQEDFELVGRHLSNAKFKYEDSNRRMERFEEKLTSVAGQPKSLETPDVSKLIQK